MIMKVASNRLAEPTPQLLKPENEPNCPEIGFHESVWAKRLCSGVQTADTV